MENANYINNVKVLIGLRVITGKDTNPPPGYTKIPVDVNGGAKGEYIYICYRDGKTEPGITMVNILQGKDAKPEPDWYKDDTDLNKGAHGEYLYLTWTMQTCCGDPIRHIIVIEGDKSDIQPPTGYTKVNVDLNKDAGGKFIYLCYLK